jgi:hypothetical protein
VSSKILHYVPLHDGHSPLRLKVRRTWSFIEEQKEEAGRPADCVLRKVATVAVVENPYAVRHVEDLGPLIEASRALGRELAGMAVGAMAPFAIQSYGKGGIVGMDGELEHANALLTSVAADELRKAVGGGKAWISSFTKKAGPGTPIDIPMACKDALYVRSHYMGMTITLHEAPSPDEIAVIFCIANRSRLNARVGGLRFEEVQGRDGLV